MKLTALPYLILACPVLTGQVRAAVTFYEELPYFSEADSPFYAGIQQGTIYLEDFEDRLLNTPHVTSWDYPRQANVRWDGTVVGESAFYNNFIGTTHRTLGRGFVVNPLTTWSVDGDDGLNGDYRGLLGDTWTTIDVGTNQISGDMDFRFTPDEFGRYPTYVGFVVTEALDPFRDVEWGTSTFRGPEAPDIYYDPLSWVPRLDSFPGDTRTHRFFGIHVDEGIWRLSVSNVRQIDHLQYGYAIPEPGTAAVLGLSGVLLLATRRRRPDPLGDEGCSFIVQRPCGGPAARARVRGGGRGG